MFRTGPILQIVLYLLKACLTVSLTRLSQYLVDQQPARPALLDTQREELRNSLDADPGECGHTDTAGVLPGGGRGRGQTEGCEGD